MKGDLLSRPPTPHALKSMSINVGRGSATHDIASARAYELKIDFLLVQEPWWSDRTKTHPHFDRHIPFGGVNVRPRAITYTQKDPQRINAAQQFSSSCLNRDYFWVIVDGITFLNVYKAPNESSAVQPLLNWTPPPKSIAIGDLNSVYWAWQTGTTRSYGQGENIEQWAEYYNISCLTVGEPIHRPGNTLDLAWSNIAETQAWVEHEGCTKSNHLPICGLLPYHRKSITVPKGPIRVPKDKLPHFAKVVSQWIPPLPSLNSVEDTENFAQELCRVLRDAIKAVGKLSHAKSGRSALWWTSECKAAHLDYQNSLSEPERSTYAKNFRDVVSSAKREYWKKRVENMKSPSEVFKLMRWAEPSNTGISPPLYIEGRFVSDQVERAEILQDSLLARYQASHDPPPCSLSGNTRMNWLEEIEEIEVRSCTIGCGNTSPGADR